MIQVFKPSITHREIEAVKKVMKSGWLGLGPKTAEFEEKFAKYVGAKYAIGLNSGTAALHLALVALDLKQNDEVLVPTITFVSTAHVVLYTGAKPVFVDVDEDTLCMSVRDLERKITPRTKAIIPVHYAGQPCDMDAIHKIASKNKIHVIEDAAHACGALYKGKKIGSISKMTCFSFHAVKNLTCGEGGMITTDDKKLHEKLVKIRWMGISKDTWMRSMPKKIYAWQYWVNELGFKAHMNDIAASIGLVQLEKLKKLNQKRRKIVTQYNKAFKGTFPIKTPPEKKRITHSWHIYHIKIPQRDKLIGFLKEKNIAPGVHYYPIHMHPFYRHFKAVCPTAERVWRNIITLPLYPDMAKNDTLRVIKAVKEFVKITDWKDIWIEARRIVLRKIDSSDLDKIRKWRNRNRFSFFDQRFITEEMMEEWFDSYLKNQNEKMFIIQTKKGDEVGMIGIHDIDRKNRNTQIGRIAISDPRFKHKGYATEATKCLANYIFKNLKLKRVYLEVFADNRNAIKLYKRCGFKTEGILKKAALKKGKRCDIMVMAIVK